MSVKETLSFKEALSLPPTNELHKTKVGTSLFKMQVNLQEISHDPTTFCKISTVWKQTVALVYVVYTLPRGLIHVLHTLVCLLFPGLGLKTQLMMIMMWISLDRPTLLGALN